MVPQPLIDALRVEDVIAGEDTNRVSLSEIIHTDHTVGCCFTLSFVHPRGKTPGQLSAKRDLHSHVEVP